MGLGNSLNCCRIVLDFRPGDLNNKRVELERNGEVKSRGLRLVTRTFGRAWWGRHIGLKTREFSFVWRGPAKKTRAGPIGGHHVFRTSFRGGATEHHGGKRGKGRKGVAQGQGAEDHETRGQILKNTFSGQLQPPVDIGHQGK